MPCLFVYSGDENGRIKDTLLYVHQTTHQNHMLKRYGSYLTLMDATYKTTKYDLPLFLLAVKTNVDYQVAGVFMVQQEKAEYIVEALNVLHDWGPEWKPETVMTDNSAAEILALKTVFPGKPEIK